MSAKKEILGNCAICLKHGKLTFEHIPPKKAMNSNPSFIQNSNHLIDENNRLFGKRSQSHKGNGLQTLCQKCNNNLGSWYSRNYISFANTSYDVLKSHINQDQNSIPSEIRCTIDIEPLNVLKQIVSIFLAISPDSSKIKPYRKLAEFVQNKNSKDFPEDIRIFMFFNITDNYNMLGFNYQMSPNTEQLVKSSEFSFKPFGFKLTNDFEGKLEMLEITSWSHFELDEMVNMNIYCPVKKVSGNIFEPFN